MILDQLTADKKLRRMALEVAERNFDQQEIILIGIKENGIYIAKKIEQYLKDSFHGNVVVVELAMDKKHPVQINIQPSIDFDNKTILLIDDVANSGRTILYALKPLLEKHPRKIQTLALVARTHKLFPIAVDYVGLSVATTVQENIVVDVENGEIIGARFGDATI